jgi:hypothetical protein
LRKGDKRFFCYVACDENYITGNFTKIDFQQACDDFLLKNPKLLNDYSKSYGSGADSRQRAKKQLINDLHQKYYKGI